MPPLRRLLLLLLRGGALGTAVVLALFMAIEVWHRWIPRGVGNLTRQDISFAVIVFLMFLGALFLARSIARELRGKSGS